MSLESEIQILRMELRLAREREAATERRLAALELNLAAARQALEARLAGANDPDSINAKIRRIEQQAGTATGSTSSPTPGTPGAGGLGSGWVGQSLAQQVETLRSFMCAVLGTGTVTAECREDGSGLDGTISFDVPTDSCE